MCRAAPLTLTLTITLTLTDNPNSYVWDSLIDEWREGRNLEIIFYFFSPLVNIVAQTNILDDNIGY